MCKSILPVTVADAYMHVHPCQHWNDRAPHITNPNITLVLRSFFRISDSSLWMSFLPTYRMIKLIARCWERMLGKVIMLTFVLKQKYLPAFKKHGIMFDVVFENNQTKSCVLLKSIAYTTEELSRNFPSSSTGNLVRTWCIASAQNLLCTSWNRTANGFCAKDKLLESFPSWILNGCRARGDQQVNCHVLKAWFAHSSCLISFFKKH